MLLSVQGPGMAAGASAVWVRDAGCSHPPPPQLGAGTWPLACPHSGDRRDLPQGLAMPMMGCTVLCSRAMCCGGGSSPREPSGLGGITSRFPARTACQRASRPRHPHRSSPNPLLQQGIPPAAIALVLFTHFSGGWGSRPFSPTLPTSHLSSSSSDGQTSSRRVLREGTTLPVWQRVSMATALSFPQRFSRQLATGATCWRAAMGRWGMGSADPRPRAGEGQGSASAHS